MILSTYLVEILKDGVIGACGGGTSDLRSGLPHDLRHTVSRASTPPISINHTWVKCPVASEYPGLFQSYFAIPISFPPISDVQTKDAAHKLRLPKN